MIALVTADKYFIDDITYRLRDMDIEPREFYSTVAGEATYALSQDERDKTAMLIDIGYLCTDVMVMEGDALIFHKCLDIGGGHISADIAEQLNIPFPFVEEKLSRRTASTAPIRMRRMSFLRRKMNPPALSGATK